VTILTSVLRLARISNLPTVWSNALAASALAGGLAMRDLASVLIAMSALYAGGMVLNDAFDRDVDARDRPERPIPSGAVPLSAAWLAGFGLLACGAALMATFGIKSAFGGLALAAAIVLYDAWHKGNPLSPLLMGVCRALVYVGTALAAGAALTASILIPASALLLYVAGLTAAAKGGAFQSAPSSWPALLLAGPPAVALRSGPISALTLVILGIAALVLGYAIMRLRSGRPADREPAIGVLIGAIAIMDAAVANAHGHAGLALVCLALFPLTLTMQRIVSGT